MIQDGNHEWKLRLIGHGSIVRYTLTGERLIVTGISGEIVRCRDREKVEHQLNLFEIEPATTAQVSGNAFRILRQAAEKSHTEIAQYARLHHSEVSAVEDGEIPLDLQNSNHRAMVAGLLAKAPSYPLFNDKFCQKISRELQVLTGEPTLKVLRIHPHQSHIGNVVVDLAANGNTHEVEVAIGYHRDTPMEDYLGILLSNWPLSWR